MFKIGIIGAGHIAHKMAYTISRMSDIELYAIASRDMERARDFANRYNIKRVYDSYENLANDPDVQLVYIATPHSHHYEHAKMCMMKGKPVLCEKAFTANYRQAKELIDLSHQNNIFISEAIWTRYMPFSKTISELVESGTIGKAMMLTAHIGYPMSDKERITKPELCGGALLDVGVYPINFAIMTFGDDIKDITSTCVKNEYGVDMQNSITFRYNNGRMAVMQSTAYCANDRQGIISGDKGYIIIDNINNPLRADIYTAEHELIKAYECPKQISGYEYEVYAAIDAINNKRIETKDMPHSETLKIMQMLDNLRKEWGVSYPMD